MSKKELLNEAQIRRFMTLANLEPLAKNVIKEEDEREMGRQANQVPPSDKPRGTPQESMKEEEEMNAEPAPEEEGEQEAGEEETGEMASGGGLSPKAIELLQSFLEEVTGEAVEVESGEEQDNQMDMPADETPEEVNAAGEGGEEEMEEGKKKKASEDEEDDEEMDESVALSEDGLVEAVLARVTARLVQEAKKAKMTPKQKAALKKKEMEAAKKKKLAEATSAEGGGPLLKQGKNKFDVYKGHADMAYAKGKEGKGGHSMETVTAKAEHTVTHGGKNLATLGGNKKKV